MCPQNVCPRGAIVALVHFQFNLRAHLKTHGGEKSNKCHQCNYGLGRRFEDTFENAQWRKVKQPLYIMTSHQPYGLTQWNLFEFSGASENSREHLRFYWSIWDFTGASVILLERLRASVGFRNFDGASEIFRSVCGISGTKKMPPWKNAPFSLHIQDRGEGTGFLCEEWKMDWELWPVFTS